MAVAIPSWATKASDPVEPSTTAKKEYLPYRWKLAVGTRRPGIFMSDAAEAVGIWEHEYQRMVKGKVVWGNFITCNKTVGQKCPMCVYADSFGKYQSAQKFFLGILDPTPYTSKAGVVIPITRRIMAARRAQLETLLREEQDLKDAGKGGLAWKACIIARPNDGKSANIGTEFRPQRQMDPATLAAELVLPINWELLAPNTKMLQDIADGLRDGSLFGGGGATAPMSTGFTGGGSALPGGAMDLTSLMGGESEFEIDYGTESAETV